MKKDQNLKCRQKSHESFSAFPMVDIESSKEEKVVNDWVDTRISDWMVSMIDEPMRKRRSYGKPPTRASTLKRVRFVKKCV